MTGSGSSSRVLPYTNIKFSKDDIVDDKREWAGKLLPVVSAQGSCPTQHRKCMKKFIDYLKVIIGDGVDFSSMMSNRI